MAALQPVDDLTQRDTGMADYGSMDELVEKAFERIQEHPAKIGRRRELKDLLRLLKRSAMPAVLGTHLEEDVKIDAVDDDLNINSSSHQARNPTPAAEHASLRSKVKKPLSC